MAKIEFIRESKQDEPENIECLDVLVWGRGGTASQELVIGSGCNFNASTNFWVEVRYSVQGIPIFYTRNIVSNGLDDICKGQLEELQKFERGERQKVY